MRKRVYVNFLCLVFLSAALLSTLLCLQYFQAMKEREITAVRDSAELIADFLNQNTAETYNDYRGVKAETLRMTIIAPDGTALFDSEMYADTLENHSDRTELIAAAQSGRGEAERYSGTLDANTYYYAVRLESGDFLRLSKPLGSITAVFSASVPYFILVTAAVMIIANLLARRLADNLIKPLYRIDMENGGTTIYDELLPYVNKINQQKLEIEEKIRALSERADTIEAITQNMREGLILIDKSGRTLAANKSALAIFGYSGVVQSNILHLCRDQDFQQGVRACLAGMSRELLLERGGKVYNVFCNPVTSGGLTGGVLFFFDTTEKSETERQRREFSANVSHELKTPLTTISALSEMLKNGMAGKEEIADFAEKIHYQAGRLFSLIEDIIRLSEFDEKEVTGEKSEFSLGEIIDTVIESLRAKADEKDITFEVRGERLNITANRQMTDELLTNLVDNAIKYNNDGGTVTIETSRVDGYTKISVSDTGIGIADEHKSRVFERFYRVDKSRSKKTGGTGLGLSIVKHITEHHGGKLELISESGKGTTVSCYLR